MLNELWDHLWKTNFRKNLACLGTIVLLSSALYLAVDWYWFYNTRALDKQKEAVVYLSAVKSLLKTDTGVNAGLVREEINALINLPRGNISLVNRDADQVVWEANNGNPVDPSRTLVEYNETFSIGSGNYEFSYRYGNRPPFYLSLFRAWSLSAADLIENRSVWVTYRLYHRSTPLACAFFIIALIAVPLFNRIFKDWHEYQFLQKRFSDLRLKNTAMQGRLSQEIKEYNARYADNLKSISGMNAEIENIRAEHSAEIELYVEEVTALEGKIENLGEENLELSLNEEQALSEKESLEKHYALIDDWLRNPSDISLLKTACEVNQMENVLSQISLKEIANKTDLHRESKMFKKLQKQLKQWVVKVKDADLSVSDHGLNHIPAKFMEKLDRDFLNSYFTKIHNDRYIPANRKSIKVSVASEGNNYSGEICVYLDHESGCSLSMAYNTKKAAKAENVGFVLAMMLKATTKELEGYQIR